VWDVAHVNDRLYPDDWVRVHLHARLLLQLSDQTKLRFLGLSEFQIQAPSRPQARLGVRLVRGLLYFFHRDKPADTDITTPVGAALLRGTEFAMEVDETTGRTVLTLIDGEAELRTDQGAIRLTSGEQGVAERGKAPTKTAVIAAINDVIQWCLYYPGVLDPDELPLGAQEATALADSLAAYRSGDLLQALAKYPPERQPAANAEKVYRAAVLLAVGQVEQSQALLSGRDAGNAGEARLAALANALRKLISAVKLQPVPASAAPSTASEWLAESYYLQSRTELAKALDRALEAARQAVKQSPDFAFGWARVAELEFSFGRTADALVALDKALALGPRNAQAVALKGFLLSAQNRIAAALAQFDRAIELDGALGNAWLGRGLCRIRQGRATEGRQDLLVAATLEPQRALLRSYLGKAYSNEADAERATDEIRLAKKLDGRDPTAYLYSALLLQQQNRINEAVRELERSQELNDNRRLYRSRLLLDQDRAVRSANLARLYADADLSDVAVREAGRALSADYANYSAHVFLANSYEAERRANLSNLRFEAVAFGEYLLANLLGPANGRLLAQPVSRLEYSSLFERNRFGVIANTEFFSRGAWHHSSGQYGTYNGSSYSLEAEYRTEPGERPNQDLELRQLEAKFKYDLTPDDSVYLHVLDFRGEGGDTAQRFDESEVARTYRFRERQTPTVLAGYHHQWSPENHTLLFAGRFDDTLESVDPLSTVLALDRGFGSINGFAPVFVRHNYRSQVEVYTAEAQQIAVLNRLSLVAGARAQWSHQSVADQVADPNGMFLPLLGLANPVSVQNEDVSSSSVAIYAYDYVRLTETLRVMGGLNFTHQKIPVNTATAPVTSQRERQERVSPKAAIIWSPWSSSSFRVSYTKSLAGAGLGQSVRLEPTHVAGMLQSFRAPAPRALVGELDGADLETAELLWEGRFHNTYLALGGQRLTAERGRRLGLFLSHEDYDPPPSLGLIREKVVFREHALDVSAHQLVAEEWSFGVRYRLAYAELGQSFPEYPSIGYGGVSDRTRREGWLHSVSLSGLYRHPSGFFARSEGLFFLQDRSWQGRFGPGEPPLLPGDPRIEPGDRFWQVNLIAGFRLRRQHGEVAVGVLNLLDDDYRLDPLNQHAELPRSRTFYARLLLNF
jgi:Tfp pilus assembly protein PilF